MVRGAQLGAYSRAHMERELHGMDVGLHALEAELGALEAAVFGAFGAGGALATGVGAGAATLTTAGIVSAAAGSGASAATIASAAGGGTLMSIGAGSLLTSSAATGAAGAVVGATGSAALGTGAMVAVAAAPVVAVAGTAAWLASYRATAKNVQRLKAIIAKYRRKIVDTQRIYGKKSPRVAARRIRWYQVRIKMARRRIDRIERVMKRRIERRQAKGKDLTARQERMLAALKRRGKPVVSMRPDRGAALVRSPIAQQERLVAQADFQQVRMGLPAVGAGLSVVAARTYVDRALPIGRDLVAQGQPAELAAQQAVAQVSPPAAYFDIVLRRVRFWLNRDATPQRFAPSAQSVGAVGPGGYQSGAFQTFPAAALIPGGPFMPGAASGGGIPTATFGPGDEAGAGADPVEQGLDDDTGEAVEDAEAPWYKRPAVLVGLAAVAGGAWYFTQGKKKGKAA